MSCRFFEHDPEEPQMDKGNCHRFPPQVSFDPDEATVLVIWPVVDWLDWCGEYQPQE